jgi:hypothetical protein
LSNPEESYRWMLPQLKGEIRLQYEDLNVD